MFFWIQEILRKERPNIAIYKIISFKYISSILIHFYCCCSLQNRVISELKQTLTLKTILNTNQSYQYITYYSIYSIYRQSFKRSGWSPCCKWIGNKIIYYTSILIYIYIYYILYHAIQLHFIEIKLIPSSSRLICAVHI